MIAIINLGIGNAKSILKMLAKSGHDSVVTNDREDIIKAERIILPGVGAFDSGMQELKQRGLLSVLDKEVLGLGKPVLGICLGMQLLARSSEEGVSTGLGWIDGAVVKFDRSKFETDLKIPHIGWNSVITRQEDPIFRDIGKPMRFYFVHSFHFKCANSNTIVAVTKYGYNFPCCVRRKNIIGVQFHPEKSHKYGMQLLKNFAERC